MKKNNHGLTLVELICVLVVLILVFLMAVFKVKDLMDKSEKNSLEADALAYVKAVTNHSSITNGKSNYPVFEGLYSYKQLTDIGIKVSGTKPTGGFVYVRDDKVFYGCLLYNKDKIVIKDGSVTNITTGSCGYKEGYNSNLKMYLADYSGSEKAFTIPTSGTYLLEVWGASGGDASDTYKGGAGAYARGYVDLDKDDILYINVGGRGASMCNKIECSGGYNGGSRGGLNDGYLGNINYAGGGGATSIALVSGTLSNLSNNLSDVLIVAGGGGGATYIIDGDGANGGSGGGYLGGEQTGNSANIYPGFAGSQFAAGQYSFPNCTQATFGQAGGMTSRSNSYGASGSGGGLYGGGCGGAGGSGYTGNANLTNAIMFCTNCRSNTEKDSLTVISEKATEEPQTNTPKIGHGYAIISLISVAEESRD